MPFDGFGLAHLLIEPHQRARLAVRLYGRAAVEGELGRVPAGCSVKPPEDPAEVAVRKARALERAGIEDAVGEAWRAVRTESRGPRVTSMSPSV